VDLNRLALVKQVSGAHLVPLLQVLQPLEPQELSLVQLASIVKKAHRHLLCALTLVLLLQPDLHQELTVRTAKLVNIVLKVVLLHSHAQKVTTA
jgi:hypothetical protein